MKLTIQNGGEYFFQWDSNQKIVLSEDLDCCKEVHFQDLEGKVALVVDVGPDRTAPVPNILLTYDTDFIAWVFNNDTERTTYAQRITVQPRQRPADYVYTETAVKYDLGNLFMAADTQVFLVDEKGAFLPGQEAHVKVDPQMLVKPLTFTGKDIPQGTKQFTVTPADLKGQDHLVITATCDGFTKSLMFTKVSAAWKKPLLDKLLMTADSNVFQTTSNGYPLPEQVNHVHVDKGTLTDPVTYEGKTIPADTLDFTVEPKDMAEKGIVLKNACTVDYTTPQKDTMIINGWGGTHFNIEPVIDFHKLVGRKVYFVLKTYYTINSDINCNKIVLYLMESGSAKQPLAELWQCVKEKWLTVSALGEVPSTLQNLNQIDAYYYHDTEGAIINTTSTFQYIDVTELSASYPQYSDEELKAILDDSLPYISAQQSKTLGGVCQMKNYIANPFSADGWDNSAGSFSRDGNTFTYTDEYSLGYYGLNTPPTRKSIDYALKVQKCFGKVFSIEKDNYALGFGGNEGILWSYLIPKNYYYGELKSNYKLSLGLMKGVQTTVTVDCSKGVIVIDTFDNLLDLWLSLNGYDDDPKKAAWCDENIPAFEGTYDLVLGMKDSLTITATCGAHTSSVTFKKAISQIKVSSIVESTKNYQKFADGALICFGKETGDSGERTVNYPLPYIEAPIYLNARSNDAFMPITAPTATGFKITKGAADVSWMAIGRWK